MARAEKIILDLDKMDKEKDKETKQNMDKFRRTKLQLEEEIKELVGDNEKIKGELLERRKEIKKINMSISKLGQLKEQANMEKEEVTTNLNKSKLEAVTLSNINKLDDISTVVMLKKLFQHSEVDNYNGLKKRELVKLFFKQGFTIDDYDNFAKNPDEEKKVETPKKKTVRNQRLPISSVKKEYEKRRQRKIKENRDK